MRRRWLFGVLVAVSLALMVQLHGRSQPVPVAVLSPSTVPAADAQVTALPVESTPKPVTLPTTVHWAAPFTSQAPQTSWDAFHEEMCEEASLLIAANWYQADTRATLPAPEAEQQLQDMAVWERATLGTDVSTTVNQMLQVATGYLQIPAARVQAVPVLSVDELKKLVHSGVVVAPFAGRLLGNPHFSGIGPRYHASVIIGYTEREFIVHDVGTRYGANYTYKTTVLWTALHDFVPEPADIATGAKRVLAFTRP